MSNSKKKFQSYNSSIKTWMYYQIKNTLHRFQSYNSSIKTGCRCLFIHFPGLHFNPTIVRLKHGMGMEAQECVCKFQSYNSSIKTIKGWYAQQTK